MVRKRIIPFEDLWDGEMQSFRLDGQKLLLLRMGAHVYAYEDRCTHQAMELSAGKLNGTVITCPAHHWEFDACTGAGINPANTCLKSFKVSVENGEIFVDFSLPGMESGRGEAGR
jgi:toluene monooxygenase system ferredoxin subunit